MPNFSCSHDYQRINDTENHKCSKCGTYCTWNINQEKRWLDGIYFNYKWNVERYKEERVERIFRGYIQACEDYRSRVFTREEDVELIGYAERLLEKMEG